MSKVYSKPYPSDLGTKSLLISKLDAKDLALIAESSDEVEEQTTYSPLDRPEKWTFGSKQVADVYKNTSIATSAKASSVRGVQLMVRHDCVIQVTDDADASYLRQLPLSCWTCVKVPVNELVTTDLALEELQRALAGLFGDGEDVSSSRLGELIRGALRADN